MRKGIVGSQILPIYFQQIDTGIIPILDAAVDIKYLNPDPLCLDIGDIKIFYPPGAVKEKSR
jgi:hypothetical protein